MCLISYFVTLLDQWALHIKCHRDSCWMNKAHINVLSLNPHCTENMERTSLSWVKQAWNSHRDQVKICQSITPCQEVTFAVWEKLMSQETSTARLKVILFFSLLRYG